MKSAASALDQAALAGARIQQIEAALNMWEKAQAGLELARKTYDRVKNLYDQGVVPEQKLDEASANYKAMRPWRARFRPSSPSRANWWAAAIPWWPSST